ncbi:endolytic transglycosylase MltG [Nocardioides koreensis]|uniref:Endolytic murein transglycosylase n=1 Tax=Nocardioides koreensis TaxID=433651 RepID=A0ABP5LFW7_9ACTN
MTHHDEAHPEAAEQEGQYVPPPRAPHDDEVVGTSADPGEDDVVPMHGGRRRRKRRTMKSCLAVIVALVVVVGGAAFVVTKGVGMIKDQFADPEDFAGPGHGKLTFEVHEGDSISAMGRNLKAEGVVASVGAFTAAAGSSVIQPGFYPLKKEMRASDAVTVLANPDNLIKDTVTIPEGLRVTDIVSILADNTDFKQAAFEKVLDAPGSLGLPRYAKGNPEGYLFPATYDFGPDATPKSILQDMVDRWKQAADDADLEGAAEQLGYTPAELMTVASLVEAEGRGDDMPKIARVIYNRLEGDETNGLLQIDATINYAADNDLTAVPTTSDTQIDSPYNTYQRPGLPPTPIEAPGDDALYAATHPSDGDWYYYVTVNLKTGETMFATTYDEFLQYKDELRQYCATESAGAC